MTRNSEIVRAGLETRVSELVANGDSAPAIAKTISQESGKPFSKWMVHRHLQKQAVNAAMLPGEHAALDRLAAAISGVPDSRDTATSAYYGLYELNTTNAFTEYYGVARGIRNGQVMRGFKNLALKITNGARIVGDENDAEAIDELSKALNFSSNLQDVVRSTCEMGTCVNSFRSTDGEFITPQIVPMRYITLLTERETPSVVDKTLVHGAVTQVVFDEGGDAEIRYEPDDIGLFRIWAGGNEFEDSKGRSTDSIYGESMTIGVETPLKSLMNAAYYYDQFIARYGMGRLHVNLKTLADMIRDKTVSATQAQVAQDADTAALQKIGPNEDIVSTGREVSMIESKTGFDIIPYLNWRAKQIDRVLLQSDVGSGDVGNSWTSAGTAVSVQDYDTYNSLRETLFQIYFDEIIVPYATNLNLDPQTISITATPYLRVNVPYRDLIDMRDRGDITQGELRDRAGFPAAMPDEE